jgi:tetratricopeptide (TPR) repeat protein
MWHMQRRSARTQTTAGRDQPRYTRSIAVHWRGVASALLLGVGTPVSIAGGWASADDRLWWLLGAGLCAGIGALLPLTGPAPASHPSATADRAPPKLDQLRAPRHPPTAAHPDQPRSENQPAQVWNIRAPVRSFTGRDPELAAIGDRFHRQQRVSVTRATALYGMGGMGKTQLARAYAHVHRDDYQVGWWIPAHDPVLATIAMGELAVQLGVPNGLPPPRLVARLHQVLASRDRWLLIFDDASSPAELEPLLPTVGGGHVLITSRNPAWQGLAEPVRVELLPVDMAGRLLRTRTGDPDRATAEALARELGQLPLAIEQAAAYAADQHLSLAGYLAAYRQRRAELLGRGQPLAYPGTVVTTVAMTLDHLLATAPAARRLLELCSLLAPDELPVRELLTVPQALPEPLATAARDPIAAAEAIGALHRAGLAIPDANDTIRLHPLVQTIVAQQTPDYQRRVVETVEILAGMFPTDPKPPETWPVCARLLPHVQALLNHTGTASNDQHSHSAALATLLSATGTYLRRRGLAHTARGLHERALAIRRRLHPDAHSDLTQSLCELTVDLRLLGDAEHARELDQEALAMKQRLYGPDTDHREIALSLYTLAFDLRALGDPAAARDLDEQALAMLTRLHPGDHPDVADQLGSLADDLRALGDPAAARDLDEQALAMVQRLHPGDHPQVACSLANLAADLRALGDPATARELDEQALVIRQRLYPGDDPHVAQSLQSLADDLRALGDPTAAQEFDDQATAMRERLAQEDLASPLPGRRSDEIPPV